MITLTPKYKQGQMVKDTNGVELKVRYSTIEEDFIEGNPYVMYSLTDKDNRKCYINEDQLSAI